MKASIRLCSLLLFIVFMVGMFAACGGNGDPAGSGGSSTASTPAGTESKGGSDTSDPDTSFVEDEDPNANVEKDYDGKTFTIASLWSGTLNPEYGSSDWGDQLLQHYSDLQDKYNCKIAFKEVPSYNQFITDFNAAMLADNYYADIIEAQQWQGREWTRKGYLAQINGLESLDLNSKKFMASKTELSEYGGNYYGTDFTSWYFRYINFNTGGMFFNTRLLESINVDPYELIEKGEWTPDKFRELAKQLTQDTNGDGVTDIWGIAGCDWRNLLWSTGKQAAVWDDAANKYVFGQADPIVYNAMQWLLDMMYVDKSVSFDWVRTSILYGASELFGKGKAAFIPMDGEWLTYGDEDISWFLDMEDDYGFIPYPLAAGNEEGEYKGQFYGEIRLFYIPKTAVKDAGKTIEDIAFFFDRWSAPLPGTNSESWKEYVRDEMFRGNQKSFDWYMTLLENAEFDRSVDMGSLQLIPWQTTITDTFLDRKHTPAEAMEIEHNAFNNYLDSTVNNDPILLEQH